MSEIHPDILNAWYNAAQKIIEYEPGATLWDLFRYQMMWEHGEDIDKVIEENLDICKDCNEEEKIHALNMCKKCYMKHLMRKRRTNEVK